MRSKILRDQVVQLRDLIHLLRKPLSEVAQVVLLIHSQHLLPDSLIQAILVGFTLTALVFIFECFNDSTFLSASNFASMQQTMQQQVMRNPELLRNVMESPLVQSLVSNPEVMRSIMQSNPQMREIMEVFQN